MDGGDCETEEDSAPEACVSPEGPIVPRNSREQRNIAEKQRRERLNTYIGQIAKLVPMIAKSAKKMDKTSILRLAATYLRIFHTLMNGRDKERPSTDLPKYLDQFVLEQLVSDQLGGFLIILTQTGKIVFVSHTVEHLLGHLQTDLMGQSLYNITSPDDHEKLRTYLKSGGDLELEWRKYFNVNLKRAGPRSESAVYEGVTMMGMRHNAAGQSFDSNRSSPSLSSCSSSSSSSSSCKEITSTNNPNDIFVFFVKVSRPEPVVDRLIEASKDEYITRHLIDGRIINCDQRISIIAGYMIEEVSGHSAFNYMHRDDVRWVMIALRQMYDRGESRGMSCYRLISRNGQFIYLRTCGFLEIDDQGIVESFVCINSLVNEKEGKQLINEMKQRYAAIINSPSNYDKYEIPAIDNGTVDIVEDPNKVEQAVLELMKNLPSPGSDNCSTPSPGIYESQDCSSSTDSYSPHKSYQVRIKTVSTSGKRPTSTEVHTFTESNKRLKTRPERISANAPYPLRPPNSDLHIQTEQPLYQQHDQPQQQLLQQNI